MSDRGGWQMRAALARCCAVVFGAILAIVVVLYVLDAGEIRRQHAHWAIPLLAVCAIGMVGLLQYARGQAEQDPAVARRKNR